MAFLSLPGTRRTQALAVLVALHISIIIASNYLVQLPIVLFGFTSTWGAFSFPFIFLATDLTVRLIGTSPARRVIARAMLPALVASYIVGVLFHLGTFSGFAALASFNSLVFRVAFASFAAYVLGRFRPRAPTQPSLVGGAVAVSSIRAGTGYGDVLCHCVCLQQQSIHGRTLGGNRGCRLRDQTCRLRAVLCARVRRAAEWRHAAAWRGRTRRQS